MDRVPPPEPTGLTDGDPFARLAAWRSDARVDEAAATRARRRWMARQAAEDASVAGVLLDLGERGAVITVHTVSGWSVRGTVTGIGVDFAILRRERGESVVLPRRALASVRPAPGSPTVTGERPGTAEVLLAEALVEWAATTPRVAIGAGGQEWRGVLRRAGIDVIAVELDGAARDEVHLAVDAIDHLVLVAP